MENSPICWFSPLQQLESGLPCRGQGPEYLNHHLLLLWVHISRKLRLREEPELKPRHSGVGCEFPKQCLNHSAVSAAAVPFFISTSSAQGLHFSHSLQRVPPGFLPMTILVGVREHLSIVLICSSVMIREAEHLFMSLLLICESALEKHLFPRLWPPALRGLWSWPLEPLVVWLLPSSATLETCFLSFCVFFLMGS